MSPMPDSVWFRERFSETGTEGERQTYRDGGLMVETEEKTAT